MPRHLLAIIVIILAIVLPRLVITFTSKNDLNGQFTIVGKIDSQPKISGQAQIFKVGQVLIVAKRYPEVNFGNRVKLVGEIKDSKMLFPDLEIITQTGSNGFLGLINNLRQKLSANTTKLLPDPQASLLAGMLLGIDKIPREFISDLKITGTYHLVVVSGQNITLVAGFFMALAGLIRRQLAITLSLIAIFIYTLLAGLEPPVIRAAIMGGLAYFGQFLGRQSIGVWSLFLSAMLMILFEPLIILNLSFILSFAATFGILVFGPILKSQIKVPIFSEEIATTISAWLITLPILTYNFGQTSLVSVFANLAISIVVIPIMILGFCIFIVGIILLPLGQLLAFIAYVPLTYFVTVVRYFASLPYAAISFEKFSLVFVAIYYFLISLIYLWQVKLKFLEN